MGVAVRLEARLVEAVPGASARHQLVSVDLSIDVFLGILKCLEPTAKPPSHCCDRLFHDASRRAATSALAVGSFRRHIDYDLATVSGSAGPAPCISAEVRWGTLLAHRDICWFHLTESSIFSRSPGCKRGSNSKQEVDYEELAALLLIRTFAVSTVVLTGDAAAAAGRAFLLQSKAVRMLCERPGSYATLWMTAG